MSNRLTGKVAIVSGGASGIGAATSLLFSREGAKGVVVADVNEVEGNKIVNQINQEGGNGIFVMLDVTQEANWSDVIASTVGEYGRLDVTVNNAGICPPEAREKVEETPLELWNQMHAVNSTGVFLGTKCSLSQLRKDGGGSIINISSIYGIVGSSGATAYHAAKGAVRTFTKAVALQYASDRIRCNSIHPGFVDTGMTADLHDNPVEREKRLDKIPIGRMGVSEDIAWGCVFLASDESSFITGIELPIDGGMIAQ